MLLYVNTPKTRQSAVQGGQPFILGLASEGSHVNGIILPPGGEGQRQLKETYHIALTFAIWIVTLILALGASSLGVVLNLTGCATGTLIAYVMPAVFSFRIQRRTATGTLLLTIGGTVGLVGTYFSFAAIF